MITNCIPAELWMLPDLWTAQTDAPPTRSLEIASAIPTSTHSPNRRSLKRKMSDTINLNLPRFGGPLR